jgi:lipopolysaccharide export system permease protein
MSYRDLAGKIGSARSPREKRPFEIVLHQRLALAFAPLFVVFIGAPLGSLARRGGGVGMFLCLLVTFGYYSLLMVGRGFADRGDLPVWISLWIPNAVLCVLGALTFFAASREGRWMRWGR